MQLKVLNEATATNSPPTLAADGFEMGRNNNSTPKGITSLIVASTAGSDAMTVTLKLWVYSRISATWMPYGTDATAANKGLLNQGNAIPEGPIADSIDHTELINGLQNYDRVYVEITAIGGTATAISAWLTERGT